MPTSGTPPTRSRRGRSLPARSDSMARSIPATAATPTASRCRDGGSGPTRAAPRKANVYAHQELARSLQRLHLLPHRSRQRRPIPSARRPHSRRRQRLAHRSTAASPACRWRRKSACKALRRYQARPRQHRAAAVLVADPQRHGAGRQRRPVRAEHAALDRLATDHRRLARRFLPDARSIRFFTPAIPATPMPASAARSSAWCSAHSPKPNSSSTPARDFTATTRAA